MGWGRETRGEEGPRGTQVNTRECIVCGERAGSVAILPYRPRVAFVSVFVGPDHFLPLRSSSSPLPPLPPLCRHHATPFCFSTTECSLSRVLLSSGAQSYVKFGTARQRGVMYDLTGHASVSLFLFICESGKKLRARAFFFSTQRLTLQSDRLVNL